ncbi:hypothetical protein SNEBB_008372 [Seison nebaliae]|nr:hypothetical protein SNEBB_008372 [Seison nebaliae]
MISKRFLHLSRLTLSKHYINKRNTTAINVPVTRGNEHLRIELKINDKDEKKELSMKEGKMLAEKLEKKLVLIDESNELPIFHLMTGVELKNLQMKLKRERQLSNDERQPTSKVKSIQISSNIDHSDWKIKIQMISHFLEKSNKVTVRLVSRKMREEKEIAKKLEKMLKELEKEIKVKFPQVITRRQSSKAGTICINLESV